MQLQLCNYFFRGSRKREAGGKESPWMMTRLFVYDIKEKSKISNQYKHIFRHNYHLLYSGGISYPPPPDTVWGNILGLRNFFVILPHFSPIIESLAAVVSHICGNKCSRNHLGIFTTVSLKQIPTKYTKIVEFARNLLGRQVQVQLLEDQNSHKINFIAVAQIVSYDLHRI